MDFHTHPHPTKSKLPSMMVAVGAHAIMLWIAMQAVQVIHRPERHIIDFANIKEPEPPKLPEPEVKPSLDKPMPQASFFPPPEIIVARHDDTGIKQIIEIAPDNRGFKLTEKTDSGGSSISTPHTPIHVAANVDARACEKPEYPVNSLRTGEEGTVYLAMLIGTDGQVIDSKIEKSSGSRALDRAAVQGLSLCKFKPGTTDGVPEKSWAKLQYVWSIN